MPRRSGGPLVSTIITVSSRRVSFINARRNSPALASVYTCIYAATFGPSLASPSLSLSLSPSLSLSLSLSASVCTYVYIHIRVCEEAPRAAGGTRRESARGGVLIIIFYHNICFSHILFYVNGRRALLPPPPPRMHGLGELLAFCLKFKKFPPFFRERARCCRLPTPLAFFFYFLLFLFPFFAFSSFSARASPLCPACVRACAATYRERASERANE